MATGITPIEQGDFSGGMNLGIKQDAPFEQKGGNTAHWMENWNPNVIQGELHTRRGSQREPGVQGQMALGFGSDLVGAIEMSHSAVPESGDPPPGYVRHVFGSTTPTVNTFTTDGAWEAGVWSDNTVFSARVTDCDVYGESLLLVSNDAAAIGEDNARLVYAYTLKDSAIAFNQKTDDGDFFLMNGIEDRPDETEKRWEILNTSGFADLIEPLFEVEAVPEDEEFELETIDAPKINGQIIPFQDGHVETEGDPPYGGIQPVKVKEVPFSLKSDKRTLNIKALGWGPLIRTGEEAIDDPTDREMSYHPDMYGRALAEYVPPGWVVSKGRLTDGYSYTGGMTSDYFPVDSKAFPVVWLMQDYVKKEKPRVFFDIERIPYVITIMVNGIERMVKKDVFEIGKAIPEGEDPPEEIDPLIGQRLASFNETSILYQDPNDPQVPDSTTYYQVLSDLPYQKARKRVKFNMRLKVDKLKKIPQGLTEIRLYVANKSKAGDKFFEVAKPTGDNKLKEEETEYSGWTEVADGLFNNPETDDQQFGYSLIKSFVVYGDPTLYKRKEIDVGHMNYGVENIYVNEWIDDGIGGFMGKWEDEGGETLSEFWLWDYMNYTAEPLASNIQGALVEYKGKGAATIANLKGVSFVAGCLDKDGKIEPGIIRKSLLQGAVQSTDIFSEVDFLKIGNETHTALCQFREQLWAFSRSQIHRIQFRDISDIATAEVLDVFEGNGTFAPKTLCVTPYGVSWLNESGVWISNGKEPELLSKNIEPLYHAMINGRSYYLPNDWYWQYFGTGATSPNRTIQIVYDPEYYEIVVSTRAKKESLRTDTPIDPATEEIYDFRAIYSVLYKNWRIETYHQASHGLSFSIKSDYLKTHFARTSYKAAGLAQLNLLEANTNTVKIFEHKPTLRTDENGIIPCSLILHEIGDGVRDMQINRMVVEAAMPGGGGSQGGNTTLLHPELSIYTADRVRQFVEAGLQYQSNVDPDDLTENPWKDNLVPYHVGIQGQDYWVNHRIDTPHENEVINVPAPLQSTRLMTSQIHLVPFMRPVRRVYVEYIMKGWGRLRSIGMWLRIFERRMWG